MTKKALLIGINYPGQKNELKGCINDVQRMEECLIDRYGFLEEDITVLIDTDKTHTKPTANNIRSALTSLVGSAKPGDVLFVHFSGHGDRVIAHPEDNNDTGFNEFVVAADGDRITDNEFRAFVGMVPRDCSITLLADCCHSGGLIEGAKEQIGYSTQLGLPNSRSESDLECGGYPHGDYSYVNDRSLPSANQFDLLKEKTREDASSKVKFGLYKSHHIFFKKGDELVESIAGPSKSRLDRGILLSACQSHQKAKEVSFTRNSYEACGVFSNAIQDVIKKTNGRVTNRDLVLKATDTLERQGFFQKPGLYCSDHHADALFLCANLKKRQSVKKFLLGLLILFILSFGVLFIIWPHMASKYH